MNYIKIFYDSKYFSSKAFKGLLNCLVNNPTNTAPAIVPSLTPSKCPKNDNTVTTAIITNNVSNAILVLPNLKGNILQIAKTTP